MEMKTWGSLKRLGGVEKKINNCARLPALQVIKLLS